MNLFSRFKASDNQEYLHIDLGQHHFGNFSMASIKGHELVEDQSQLESGSMGLNDAGPFGTFIGVYDGHSGPDASIFTRDKLFEILQRNITNTGTISTVVLRQSVEELEHQYLKLVKQSLPNLLLTGTCLVVCVISGGQYYIGNVGHCRAVLGKLQDRPKGQVQELFKQIARPKRDIRATALTASHSLHHNDGIQDLENQHRNKIYTEGFLRVKSSLQASRTIGNAFLKRAYFNNCSYLDAKYKLHGRIDFPAVSSVPWTDAIMITPEEKFIIFASHGFWEYIDDQEAVEIVHGSSAKGVARRLIKNALTKAALAKGLTYKKLKALDAATRITIHEDITVIVIFLDQKMINSTRSSQEFPRLGVRTYGNSRFQPGLDGASGAVNYFLIKKYDNHSDISMNCNPRCSI